MRLKDDNELFICFLRSQTFDEGIDLGWVVRVVLEHRKLRILIKNGLATRHTSESCQSVVFYWLLEEGKHGSGRITVDLIKAPTWRGI